MDDNRFFKTVWRFNALALALILILAASVFVWELVFRDLFRARSVAEVVNIDSADETIVETFKISVVKRVNGHSVFRVNLQSEQTYNQSYSSKGTRQTTVNTGFYDPATGQTVWIFPTQKQLITDVRAIYLTSDDSGDKDDAVVHSYLVTFVDQDTSNDQRLSNSDKKSVLSVMPNGTDTTLILTGLESDPTVSPTGSGTHSLFFMTQEGQQSVTYDARTLELGVIRTISKP